MEKKWEYSIILYKNTKSDKILKHRTERKIPCTERAGDKWNYALRRASRAASSSYMVWGTLSPTCA